MNVSEPDPEESKRQRSHVLFWLMICILAMITTKTVLSTTGANQSSRIAGKASGDIAVDRDVVSQEVDGWKCIHFQSPETTSEAFWWSHHWTFARASSKALVAFDQAGWKGWHELTECYQNTGWTLTGRSIVKEFDEQQRPWDCAMATLSNGQGTALLLFSEFYEDGSPVTPRSFTLQEAIDWAKRNDLAEQPNNLTGRLGFTREKSKKNSVTHNRVLQCQVFVVSTGNHIKPDSSNLRRLHLQTREEIRKEWMRQSKMRHTNDSLDPKGDRP